MITKTTSLKRCIDEISSKTTDYKHPEHAIDQAESLKSLSSDLYTDNIRFIYELIQNADDAQAINITLSILDDKYLIIAHDGKPFDEKDLQGLCGVNNGTKKKDLNKTGYKGLGFKAVFGKSNEVMIYSNEEYFQFNASHKIEWKKEWGTHDQQKWEQENGRQFIHPWQINPLWIDQNKVPTPIKDFLDPKREQIHVANIIVLKNIEEISLAIDQLKQQPHMFLFLRNISQMTFTSNTTDVVQIDRKSINGLKKIYFNQEIISQWIIKRFELDVPDDVQNKLAKDTKAPDKLRSIKQAEMFFAAKYNDKGTIEKLQDKESYLFSYLPTKIFEYIFPVLINANFLTNVNREQIHTDSAWNQWLFDGIGIKLYEWIKELVMSDQFHYQAYKLLPSKLNLTNNNLSKQFNEAFDRSIQHCRFIRNRQNELLMVNEAIMDSTSMSEQTSFINIDSMRKFIIDYHNESHFQCAKYPFISYDTNLDRVGVRHFTWQNCIEMFNSDIFRETHSIEQNKKMIEYFHSKCPNLETTDEIEIPLKEIPFLMDQNNRLQSIKDIYFPGETIGDFETNVLFVNKKIFKWLNENKQKEIKEWLEKLGVKEPTDLIYLKETIIPNAATYITRDNAIKTIRMLFKIFQNTIFTKKEREQLKKLKLLTTCGTLIPAEKCFFSDEYNPRLRLEEYLKGKEDRFLSFNYIKRENFKEENEDLAEWRRLFMALGVQEELCVIEFQQKLPKSEAIRHGFCDNYLSKISYDYHKVEGYSGLITITFLEYTKDDYEFAKFFWSYVIQNIKTKRFQQNTKIYWGRPCMSGTIQGKSLSNVDYVEWFVKNIQCIPTTLNICQSSSNIFIDTMEMKELCGDYMCFPSISLLQNKTDWYRIFNFKSKLSINDYLILLAKIRQDEKNLKTNLDRIQLLYSNILKDIESYSACEKNVIKSQKSILYLLSENNQWKLVNDLYLYVDNSGTNNHLNDVFSYPKLDFNNKNHPNLQKFAELFGITQITMNDFKFNDENSSPAEKFREKLIKISPFIKTWLKKSNFTSAIILSIDRILQQETQFIESDYLKFVFKGKLIQETNVFFDTIHQKFYITRQWDTETTFIDLPNKLCQLLKIQGFEGELRFLLKAENEEISKYFKKCSIEVPSDEDIVSLKPLPRSEIVEEAKPLTALPSQSNTSTIVKNKETTIHKIADNSSALKQSNRNPENQKNITSPSVNMGIQYGSVSVSHVNHGWVQVSNLGTNGENFENIEVIDLSDIITSGFETSRSAFNKIEGNVGSHQRMVGDIGEEMVYKYLQKKYSSQTRSISIKWENENCESHLPYDILLIKNRKKYHIEVKSTRTNDEHSFSLSINQIEAIVEHRQYYSIYRVYTETKKLIILNNIHQCLTKQHLNCILAINSQSVN